VNRTHKSDDLTITPPSHPLQIKYTLIQTKNRSQDQDQDHGTPDQGVHSISTFSV